MRISDWSSDVCSSDLNGVGAAIGPALAGVLMSHLGPRALFLYFAIVFAALTVYTLWRLRNSIESPAATTFQAMVRTTPEATHMLEDNAELPTEQREIGRAHV